MTVAARLTLVETAVARLVVSRGPRVSELLKQARARSRQGEVAPALHDVATLEVEARLPGLRGAMARARLRMLRGIAPEGLSAGTVGGTDVHGPGGGGNPAVAPATRSTGSTVALASDSVVDRIDQLLAAHAGV